MMRSVFAIVGLVFVISGFAFGQVSDCPTVAVDGPENIVKPGEMVEFKVRIEPKNIGKEYLYKWTVSSGDIWSSTTKSSILVRAGSAGVTTTATVEVEGLPAGCVSVASDSLPTYCPVGPELIEEFAGSLDRIAKERFEEIVRMAKADPNAQLVVIMSGGTKNPAVLISRKRVVIMDQIVKKLHGHRITFLNSKKNDDRVMIWLVPAGAEIPKIDG